VNAAVGVSAGHTSESFSTGQHGADRKAQPTRAEPAATYDVNIRNGLYATRLRMRRPFRCVVYDHCLLSSLVFLQPFFSYSLNALSLQSV